jgi:hypothetical protein
MTGPDSIYRAMAEELIELRTRVAGLEAECLEYEAMVEKCNYSYIVELEAQLEASRKDTEKWKQIAEYQYARYAYPGKLELGQGALDAYAKKWTTYEAALASRPKRKEQPIEETVEVPCCGYKASINDHPVKWNPWNKVVQCHNCGQIWEALVKQSDRKPDEPNGGAK